MAIFIAQFFHARRTRLQDLHQREIVIIAARYFCVEGQFIVGTGGVFR